MLMAAWDEMLVSWECAYRSQQSRIHILWHDAWRFLLVVRYMTNPMEFYVAQGFFHDWSFLPRLILCRFSPLPFFDYPMLLFNQADDDIDLDEAHSVSFMVDSDAINERGGVGGFSVNRKKVMCRTTQPVDLLWDHVGESTRLAAGIRFDFVSIFLNAVLYINMRLSCSRSKIYFYPTFLDITTITIKWTNGWISKILFIQKMCLVDTDSIFSSSRVTFPVEFSSQTIIDPFLFV